MGCCLGRPVTDVEKDPSVSSYVDVGDIFIVRGSVRTEVKGCCNGLMYIQGDSLNYETRCGSNLCCGCCRHRFQLAQINAVEIVDSQQMTVLQVGRFERHGIRLTPGLKITADPNIAIYVAMPDAAMFGEHLKEATENQQRKDGKSSSIDDGF